MTKQPQTRDRRPKRGKQPSKAGLALSQVCEQYGISQNRVAVQMGIARSTINQWCNDISDPLSNSIGDVATALTVLNKDAGAEFLRLYLGDKLTQILARAIVIAPSSE